MSLQRIKKYVNKKTLLNIFAKENIEKEIPEILEKFKSLAFVTIDEITEVVRRCCFYFLRNISLISILASKRISALSKREHLKKRRQLSGIVSGKLWYLNSNLFYIKFWLYKCFYNTSLKEQKNTYTLPSSLSYFYNLFDLYLCQNPKTL